LNSKPGALTPSLSRWERGKIFRKRGKVLFPAPWERKKIFGAEMFSDSLSLWERARVRAH
jgi:hypothetical protein